MAAKKQNENGTGELNTIRDILMGQHIDAYEKKFSDIEIMIEKMKEEIFAELDELRETGEQNSVTIQNDIMKKLNDMGKVMEKNRSTLEKEIKHTNESLNDKIAAAFSDFGKRLLSKR